MQLRNQNIEINEGEFFIVPQGIEHRPIAENEVWVMLFEPASTLNTGNVIDDKTKTDLEKI
jgi:mannose-6-phosphate isomerase-like protein (cupin superfamily)